MGKTVDYMSYSKEPALLKISHLWQNEWAWWPHEMCLAIWKQIMNIQH